MAVRSHSWAVHTGALVLAALLGGFVTWIVMAHHANKPTVPAPQPMSMTECLSGYVSGGAEAPSISKVHQFSTLCSGIIFAQHSMNDFNLRRLKMFQQQYDGIVLLWMVVAITLSGVLLAGFQLFVSFRLASVAGSGLAEAATEITVEQNRLIFKSSVTGLAILLISFAFFLVFVLQIYTLRETSVDPKSKPEPEAKPTPSVEVPVSTNGYGAPATSTPKP